LGVDDDKLAYGSVLEYGKYIYTIVDSTGIVICYKQI
jgi:hypothetical protein